MRTVSLAKALCVLTPIALAALGCRTNPNEMFLERELRFQEDEIYHLQAMLDDCCAARETLARENETLKRELSAGDGGDGRSSLPPGPRTGPPREPPPRSRPPAVPDVSEPVIELNEVSGPAIDFASPDEHGVELGTGRPTQLVINRRLTGGLDRDGAGGDEGLFVVVELRDSSGRMVNAPGTVSIVAMDPKLPGTAARVARWDFPADQVPEHFQQSTSGNGLQFELPWPAEPPQNPDLRLYVRFTTDDGRKLNAEAPLDIRAPLVGSTIDRPTRSPAAAPSRTAPPTSRLKSNPATPPRGPASAERPGDRQAERSDRPQWRPYR